MNSPELACQGITLNVDTEAESNAYDDHYISLTRRLAAADSTETPSGDPCSRYAGTPAFGPTQGR